MNGANGGPPLKAAERLPVAERCCSRLQSVRMAGATDNYHLIHWDDAYARSEGLPGAIVNSGLLMAWLEDLLDETYGADLTCRSVSFAFRRAVPLDATVRCGGAVESVDTLSGGTRRCTLSLWIDGVDGTRHVEASAVVEVRA